MYRVGRGDQRQAVVQEVETQAPKDTLSKYLIKKNYLSPGGSSNTELDSWFSSAYKFG
jgi:hypothetical protein